MDGITFGSMTWAYGVIRNVIADMRGLQRIASSADPRITRWRTVVKAHGLDPLTAFMLLGITDAPVKVSRDENSLSERLTAAVLQQTADYFGVRIEWLLGSGERVYESCYLEVPLETLVDELLDWSSVGTGHCINVFKSTSDEIEDSISQSASLSLERTIGGFGNLSVTAHRPVYSVRFWADDEQRWLALRAIWAAWHLGFGVRGYTLSERECVGIAEGTVIPGSLVIARSKQKWHPDDYVVRPSVRAKGKGWIDPIEKRHGSELRMLAESHGISLRSWSTRKSAAH